MKDIELQPHEKKHYDYLRDNSHECTLFLNKNDAFPLTSHVNYFSLDVEPVKP